MVYTRRTDGDGTNTISRYEWLDRWCVVLIVTIELLLLIVNLDSTVDEFARSVAVG